MTADPVRLRMRHDCSGGEVSAEEAQAGLADLLRAPDPLIFLVHGFDDTYCFADGVYGTFCNDVQRAAGDGVDWTDGGTLVRVYWPGDSHSNPLFYPWSIPHADQAAAVFADVLEQVVRQRPEVRLRFIAHSLGNRVVLQTCSMLGARGLTARIERSLQMAAAVPTLRLEAPTDSLREGLDHMLQEGFVTSVFSSHDWVLAFMFGPGETVDFTTEGVFPTALGHARWDAAPAEPRFAQQSQRLGHTQYWQKISPDSVLAAMTCIASVPRTLTVRETDLRGLPVAADVASRSTPEREPGSACGCA